MKEQSPLSPAELREAFDKSVAEKREAFDKNGSAAILRHLSDTVSTLQQNGADISVTVRAGGHAAAYDMMYTVSGNNGGTIDAYGFIKSGASSYLFAVASRHNQAEVCRLYLSRYNLDAGGVRMESGTTWQNMHIPGENYDFGADENALGSLQKKLAGIAAETAVVKENDPCDVFNREPAGAPLPKPAARLKL